MRRSTIAITLLTVALVVSNAWLAYRVLDAGVTLNYQSASLEESQQALSQALEIFKTASTGNPSKAKVIEAARAASPAAEPFEKA